MFIFIIASMDDATANIADVVYSNSVKTDIYLQTEISRDGGTDVCINRKKIIELQQINANDTTKMTTIIISAIVLH